jgi:hypothetical protein
MADLDAIVITVLNEKAENEYETIGKDTVLLLSQIYGAIHSSKKMDSINLDVPKTPLRLTKENVLIARLAQGKNDIKNSGDVIHNSIFTDAYSASRTMEFVGESYGRISEILEKYVQDPKTFMILGNYSQFYLTLGEVINETLLINLGTNKFTYNSDFGSNFGVSLLNMRISKIIENTSNKRIIKELKKELKNIKNYNG